MSSSNMVHIPKNKVEHTGEVSILDRHETLTKRERQVEEKEKEVEAGKRELEAKESAFALKEKELSERVEKWKEREEEKRAVWEQQEKEWEKEKAEAGFLLVAYMKEQAIELSSSVLNQWVDENRVDWGKYLEGVLERAPLRISPLKVEAHPEDIEQMKEQRALAWVGKGLQWQPNPQRSKGEVTLEDDQAVISGDLQQQLDIVKEWLRKRGSS